MNNILTAPSCGFEGFYLLEVIQQDGTLKQGEGLNVPFKNLLLDNFFLAISPNGNGGTLVPSLSCCRVGTSSTPPAVTDTNLGSQLAISLDGSYATSYASSAGTGYWRQVACTFTFSVGAVVGNISEVGIANSGNYLLLSRSLIKDSNGNPTTITLVSTDQLKVTYSIRRNQPTVTTSGTLALVRDGVTENHPWVWYPNSADASYPNPLPIYANARGGGGLYYTTGTPAANDRTGVLTPLLNLQNGSFTSSSYNSTTKTVTTTYTFDVGTAFPSGFNIYRPLSNYEAEGYFYFPTPVTKTATQKLVITSSYSMVAL